MFWIYAENRVDSIEMFFLLLSSTFTALRPFLLLILLLQVGGCTEWEGETARAADLK